MGRIYSPNYIISFVLFACRMSVASTAVLQIPAFFASCTVRQEEETGVRIRLDKPAGTEALDIFFFDAREPWMLDSYQQAVPGNECSFVLSGPGEKIVAALPAVSGDLYRRADVARLQDLKREAFSLEQDSPLHPFAYGLARVKEGSSRQFTIQLQPLICSIRVRSVSCDFSGRNYSVCSFHNDNLFLVNVVSESCPLAAEGGHPVSWLNYGFPANEMTYVYSEGIGDIGPERVYSGKSFYCYPNPEAKPPTRLVLEGTVGDVHCYYPIDIPLPRGGMSYDLDITLHRMGTDSPDCAAEPGTYTVEYNTVPWTVGTEREEVYSSTGKTDLCLSCKPLSSKAPNPDPVLISDYNILIYNCFGVLEESVYVPEREIGEAVYTATLMRGQPYTILAAANLGYALGNLTMDQALSFRHYLAYPDEYSHGIPMAAVLEDVAGEDVIEVRLERLMGAVDVRVDKSGLDPGVKLAVKEIRIGNCPMWATLFTPGKAAQFFSNGFSLSGTDLYPLDRGEAVRLYLLENLSGENPSSYVEIKSVYTGPECRTAAGEYLIYRFWIGDGDTYGIGRNTIQSVVVRPIGDGLSGDSWRVDRSALVY